MIFFTAVFICSCIISKTLVCKFYSCTNFISLPALAHCGAIPRNATEEMKGGLLEIAILQDLLNGYNSILYRYNEESIEGRKLTNFQSSGIDRPRSKYTKEEAIDHLHNVDDIFPIYGNYFNITEVSNTSSFKTMLNERVLNISTILEQLEAKYPSSRGEAIQSKFVISSVLLCCLTFL